MKTFSLIWVGLVTAFFVGLLIDSILANGKASVAVIRTTLAFGGAFVLYFLVNLP